MFHLHLHVVPRWQRDGFGYLWLLPRKYTDTQLENVADHIRAALLKRRKKEEGQRKKEEERSETRFERKSCV